LFIDPRWKEDPQEDEINEKECAATQLKRKETNTLQTTSDLSSDGVVEISSSLRQLLADVLCFT